jgi:GntR family transcriptional regulator
MPASALYAKVEEASATEIAQGEYPPGDQLPTEDALLQRFQVSRITVRRAIQNLVRRGLLVVDLEPLFCRYRSTPSLQS